MDGCFCTLIKNFPEWESSIRNNWQNINNDLPGILKVMCNT